MKSFLSNLLLSSVVLLLSVLLLEGLCRILDRAPELVRERTAPPMCATLLHYSSFNGSEELAHAAVDGLPHRISVLRDEAGEEVDAVRDVAGLIPLDVGDD